ncbi:MAG: hypothetical protein GKC05_05760 [Methanomicrobiales archaeon]|nr:hypothetical protein [Methanomicrobiales archaeon]NYT20703.1 hypothetical protein [Methanomicrobiales archaeon]
MARTGTVLLLLLLFLTAGCTTAPGGTALSGEERENVQAGVRDFLGDANYTVNLDTVQIEKDLFVVRDNQTAFFLDPVSGRVVRAEFSGPSAIALAEQTMLYQDAMDGIRAFLQNDEYSPEISRIVYENERYRIEGPGILFRVNTTSHDVVTAELIGEEAVSAINQSDQYHRVREAVSNTT